MGSRLGVKRIAKSRAEWWVVKKLPLKPTPKLPAEIERAPIQRGGYGGLRRRGMKLPQAGISYLDYLRQLSEFGGTMLERLVDGAASQLGIRFDAAQFFVQLTMTAGGYTLLDRVIFNPPTAIYIDGIQHELRLNREMTDQLQDMELQNMGWRVVRLHWLDLLNDPLGTVARVLWAS